MWTTRIVTLKTCALSRVLLGFHGIMSTLKNLKCTSSAVETTPELALRQHFTSRNTAKLTLFVSCKRLITKCRQSTLCEIPIVSRIILRWLEIVSWRARPGPLIARARASTQAHAGANLAILYPQKFCKIYISIENISGGWRWKFVKFGTVVKNGQKFLFWSKEKIL